MQDVRVSKELDIADIQDHVQRKSVTGILEDLDSVKLGIAEWGNDAGVRETCQRANVIRVPSEKKVMLAYVLCENGGLVLALCIHDRSRRARGTRRWFG